MSAAETILWHADICLFFRGRRLADGEEFEAIRAARIILRQAMVRVQRGQRR